MGRINPDKSACVRRSPIRAPGEINKDHRRARSGSGRMVADLKIEA
jgi:hypothetical protein